MADQTRVGVIKEKKNDLPLLVAQPPPMMIGQSSKKTIGSDAYASKTTSSSCSTGWQIMTQEDEGHVSDMEDTDNAHIPKVSTTTWFKPIPEGERPATPEPEWTIPPNDFLEPENNWANTYATTYQVPAENKLQRKTYDIGSFIKWFCRRTGKKKLCKADLEGPAFNLVKAFHKNIVFLQYQMDECHKLLTNKVDLGDKERKIALSISKLKAARYLDFGLEELVPSLWVESEREYDISAVYGITHWKSLTICPRQDMTSLHTVVKTCDLRNLIIWNRFPKYYFKEDYTIVPKPRAVVYRDRNDQRKLMRLNELHKFSDGTLTRVMEKLDHMVKDFHLFEYNKGMETRKWSEDDKRR
ncbi:hypothetical protein Tco_0999344 [Tanacetum coccineum]